MKSRLFVCILALFAVVAASCGSDDPVIEAANDPVVETSVATDDEADASADETTEDDEPVAADDADSATDATADDEPAAADGADSATDATADDEPVAADGADSATDATADDESVAADEDVSDVPQRIVSLNPTATEMLFAIGAGDQVVAVDQFSYYPAEAPVTDLSGFEPNIEAIAGFEPDLVVTDFALEGLEVIGIANHALPAATNLDEIYAQIEQLGALTGHVGEAAELVLRMQTDIDAVLVSLPARETPLTYYHELDNTLFSVTSATFIGYVYDLFGLVNIADPADADGSAYGYPQLNEEFIITANPDIVFLADTICCGQTAETAAARPGWDQLSAVQNGNVVELNDDIVSRWGPRIVDFIEAVGIAVNELETAPAS